MNTSRFKNAICANVFVISIGLALLAISGCSTASSGQRNALQLNATGDAGLEFNLVVTRGGAEIQNQLYTVPTSLLLEGRDLEFVCVHGKKPGNLDINVTRDGLSVSVSSTSAPRFVSEFKVRNNEIAMTTRMARAAAAANATE